MVQEIQWAVNQNGGQYALLFLGHLVPPVHVVMDLSLQDTGGPIPWDTAPVEENAVEQMP